MGNDFLPHLPGFHIGEDIFPIIWDAYKKVIITCDTYITTKGVINMCGLEKLFRELDSVDSTLFEDAALNFQFMDSKKGKGGGGFMGKHSASKVAPPPAVAYSIGQFGKPSIAVSSIADLPMGQVGDGLHSFFAPSSDFEAVKESGIILVFFFFFFKPQPQTLHFPSLVHFKGGSKR